MERWFRNLTDKRIRRGSFGGVADLIAAIEEFIATNNDTPKPFVWTASVEQILAKISRCKSILETLHNHAWQAYNSLQITKGSDMGHSPFQGGEYVPEATWAPQAASGTGRRRTMAIGRWRWMLRRPGIFERRDAV